MEKQLKDYLHLYLGCDTNFGILEGVRGKYVYTIVNRKDTARGNAEDIKLILRPLINMTDEEKYELDIIEKNTVINSWEDCRKDDAEKTKYLLSRHFDLFGLIDEKLAIDKTKIY